MVKYSPEEVEEKCELSPDLKSHKKKKKKHSKDKDGGNAEITNSTECIPSPEEVPEESDNKKHKKHKKKQKNLEEEIQEESVQEEVPVSKENPEKSDVEPKENGDSEKPANESKKKKRKHKEEIVVVDDDHDHKEEKRKKKKKHKHPEEETVENGKTEVSLSTENPEKSDVELKENNDSEKPAKESKKKKRKHKEEIVADDDDHKEEKPKKKKNKQLEGETAETEKTEEVPVSKENPDKSDVDPKENDSEKPADVASSKENPEKSDVEPKENDDSEKPANADGKKKRKPRHPGREERKQEKLKMKKLIADGLITPDPKIKIKRKRKRKVKRIEKAKASTTVSPADATPRPKGDIPLEDESTAERKAKKFLKLWKKDKEKWKFIKARQNWLVHHMYNPEKINDKKFKVVLKYVAGMKGNSRKTTLEQAKCVLDTVNGETKGKIHKKIELPDKPGEIQIERARKLIEML